MATLRRPSSLDTAPHPSSNPAPRIKGLTRHYSLPNLFLCQPELSVKALCSPTSSPRKCTYHSLPHSIDAPSLHSLTLCSKLSICRALSTDSFDELSYFNIPTADQPGLSARPTSMHGGHQAHGFQTSPRKEGGLAAVGNQRLDLERSIVYSDLKESMRKFEAPPRSLTACDAKRGPYPASSTHTYTYKREASVKPIGNPTLGMGSSTHGVEEMPLSLRMLKRKLSRAKPQTTSDTNSCGRSYRSQQLNQKHNSKPQVFSDVWDSLSRSLASLFYIMKILQLYAHSLRIRSNIFESNRSSYENLVGGACMEMLDSFLWLFQQVFSGTPGLMLLTMVLLADFTLHSMSMHVAFPVMLSREPPTPSNFVLGKEEPAVAELAADVYNALHYGHEQKHNVLRVPSKNREERWHEAHRRGSGNGAHEGIRRRDSGAEDPHGPQSETTAEGRAILNGDNTHSGVTIPSFSSSKLHNFRTKRSDYGRECKEIDRMDVPMKLLVAPVCAPILEPDNYPCFDQTDLAYQHEISTDPHNPLLLANYAQFLHLVRHDYGRAEELYKRAVSAESDRDGNVMERFANFLWVAKGDVAEADRMFKAATTTDPMNAYHAGNYAHFLWNSSAGQA